MDSGLRPDAVAIAPDFLVERVSAALKKAASHYE